MLQLTCEELTKAGFGLPEVLLLDTPTNSSALTLILAVWYHRSTPGGTCFIYLRDASETQAWCAGVAVECSLAAQEDGDDAAWWLLRRSTFPDRFDQLAAFTGESRELVLAKCHAGIVRTKEAWDSAPTASTAEREAFYGTTDAYLYELIVYEDPIPVQQPAAEAQLRQFELAHGSGGLVLRSAQYGPIAAYDISEVMRAFLRFRVARYYPHLADRIQVLDEWASLPLESFDLVHAYHVLEHMDDPQDVLRRLAGLLKVGGHVHVIAPFDAVGPEYPEHNPNLAHLTVPDLFEAAGLEQVNTYPVGVWQAYVGVRR
ncbi:MAG: class I SAM-dependent methyltransferase [Armatimonadetes bacterium]|nr:class I SAM-dependent methyltransferase [Armatimonadota bacterium]